MPKQEISLAIIEDDENIRHHLSEQIRLNPYITRLEEFTNSEDALQQLSTNPVDVAMFDIKLPGMSGIECIRRLKIIHPRMQMIVLTVYDNSDLVFDALRAGASSYILKNTPPLKIIEAVQEAYNGGSIISSQIARKLIEAFRFREVSNDFYQTLSRREQEILEQLARGFQYKEIAERLFISTETVRTHIRHIYEKLHVNNRVEALKKTGLL